MEYDLCTFICDFSFFRTKSILLERFVGMNIRGKILAGNECLHLMESSNCDQLQSFLRI